MQYYDYEHNGTEVTLWRASGNVGKPLAECLQELDAAGVKYNRDEIPPDPDDKSRFPTCTQRQIRLWLLSQGVTAETVRSMIGAMPDATQREAALIEFEYATEYRRDHPLVTMFGTELGLTEEQIDDAFVAATNL
jgi:uncharacterized protein YdiU (UPF0061 family)